MTILTIDDASYDQFLAKGTEGLQSGLLVNGSWRDNRSDKRFAVDDPARRTSIGSVSDGDEKDAIQAVDAAWGAQEKWGRTSFRFRADILRRAYDTVLLECERLAILMTLEMGKPLAEARAEVRYSAEFLRWSSEYSGATEGRFAKAPDGTSTLITRKVPVGVCVLVTPWNFPLAMAARKIAPAIAAGCTMVVKPAHLTPLSTIAFSQILMDCGLPAGVLNVVTTTRSSAVVTALLDDQRTRKVSFTGSTPIGKSIASTAAQHMMRVSMELGGNAPFIVFEDADIDAAVAGALSAKMRNIGQACTAVNRFIVQKSVAQEFTQKLTSGVLSLEVGHGLRNDVEIGPLISEKAKTEIRRLLADAERRGARICTRHAQDDAEGSFLYPTVVDQLPVESGLWQNEIFGPVAPIRTFNTEGEAIAEANDTATRLAAYAFTSDINRFQRVMDELNFGMIGLNRGLVSNPAAPFGGMADAGIGREGGHEGVAEFQDIQYVALDRCPVEERL